MTTPDPRPVRVFTIMGDGETLLGIGTDGVLRSDDGGRTWQLLAPQLAGLVECIDAASGPEPGRVMLAGGMGGIWRSADDGATWTATLTGSPIYAVAMTTDRSGALVALAGTAGDGIFRSLDGGQQWASASAGLFDFEVLDLTLSPTFETDNTAFAATAAGLYRSRNGGRAWRRLETPTGERSVQCVAIAPVFQAVGTVLAGTEDHGLLRSTDGGESWVTVIELDGLGVAAIVWSRVSPSLVVASTARGMARSDDDGATWRIVAHLGPVLSLAAISVSGDEFVLGSLVGGNLIASSDEGESWQERAATIE